MALSSQAFKRLRKIVGKENCSREAADVVCYAYDASSHDFLPDAVVFPGTTAEVADVLKLAGREPFFVVPRGSGSGMTGGSLAVKGGVVLVTSRLNKILELDRDNFTARVQPGVITAAFQREVEKEGMFYPPDPSSADFSTLGGNVAECAGGPRAVKYGVTRDYVMGLEAVLPSGETINTGVRTAKGVVGYDLTRLLTGSEGTLAVITAITLKLLPLPAEVRTMTAVFDDVRAAAETVSGIIKSGIIPRTMEFLDDASLQCAERSCQAGFPTDAGAMLILEVDGAPEENRAALSGLTAVCREHGATDVTVAADQQAAETLWRARKAVSPALYAFAPDKINEDIVVPRSKIPDIVDKIRQLKAETGLMMAGFGHAGDGNLHVNIMLDRSDEKQSAAAQRAVEALFDETIRLGGTISGEHGVGISKAAYLHKEVGPAEIKLMQALKKMFDPQGILNPGKIFP